MPAKKQAPLNRRQEASEQRRQAVLDAGLAVFASQGFAAARLDDVAERAGVAKGTIYLFFKDKEDLFEQIVVGAASPILEKISRLAATQDLPFDAVLSAMFAVFRSEILGTSRKEIIRLVLAEGRRFPRIAKFYHREVISKGLGFIQTAAHRAYAAGELPDDTLVRFPHLVFAPLVVSLIWDGLFSASEELDIERLLEAHRKLITRRASAGGSRRRT